MLPPDTLPVVGFSPALAHLREKMMARLGVTPDASTRQQMLSAYRQLSA